MQPVKTFRLGIAFVFVFLPLPTMDSSSLWSPQEARANYSTLLLAALKENSCPYIQTAIFERTVYRCAAYYQHMDEIEQHFQKVEPGMKKQNIFLSKTLLYHCFYILILELLQFCLDHCQRCFIVKVRLVGLQRHCYSLVNAVEGISALTIRI